MKSNNLKLYHKLIFIYSTKAFNQYYGNELKIINLSDIGFKKSWVLCLYGSHKISDNKITSYIQREYHRCLTS